MNRSAVALERRSIWPTGLAAVALLSLVGGLGYMVLRPAPETEPVEHPAVSGIVASPAPSTLIETSAPRQEAPKAPPITASTRPKNGPPTQSADMPYRFIGSSASGSEPSIVLFGRGRIVTLHGPGRLDDEYMVEAVFDDYLVLRHGPTGVGKFLQLAPRQQVLEPPRDPEDSPRD